jgi:hypothetical protein
MTRPLVERIAEAVLYEGYLLYPYRPSVKNQQRWTFGGVHPRVYHLAQGGSEPCTMRTECLLSGKVPTIQVRIKFLHLRMRWIGALAVPLAELPAEEPPYEVVPALKVGDTELVTWQEATEQTIALACAGTTELRRFIFPGSRQREPVRDSTGRIVALVIREQRPIEGVVSFSTEALGPELFKLCVEIENQTPLATPASMTRDDALLQSLISTHTILTVQDGEFVSLMDPPDEYRQAASRCHNEGTWPVLVGSPGQKDTLLSSPIILYDYPEIAPESAGDLFDATEIDEILTLRILTLSESEKVTMAAVDERARALLQRTEALTPDELLSLHGTVRGLKVVAQEGGMENWDPLNDRPGLASIRVGDVELHPGDRVRLRPLGRADILDLALDGKTATIESIEQDLEDRIYIVVTVDDDPGQDWGRAKQPGHRFYFGVEEVELLEGPPDEGGS